MWSSAGDNETIPYIIEKNGLIVETSLAFCEFTNYSRDALLGKTLETVFHVLLRIHSDLKYPGGKSETVLFTRTLEAKNIIVQKVQDNEFDRTKYIFIKISDSVFESNHFIEKLISDNVIGIGVFIAPEFILAKANPVFLKYMADPFNTREHAYGKSIRQLIPDFEGGCGGKGWRHLAENNQSIYITEKQGLVTGRDNRYWDNTLVPVRENGQLQYLVSMLEDVTERVFSREHITKQTKIIMQQKERAELIMETAGMLLKSDRPQEIIEDICIKVMHFLDCDLFFNYIVDQSVQRLHLNACAGIPEESVKGLEWIDYGVTVCGCAARDGCAVVTENVQETPDDRTVYIKSIGIRAYACHPLMDQNRVIGTLAFGTKQKSDFSKDDLTLMKTVADQVAVALNRIRTEQLLVNQQLHVIKAEIEKNEALRNAIEAKDEFLSLISHEFKTPLTVINSAIQAMQLICRNELSDKAKGFLNKILQNSNRQLKLVNNLLDITRANTGHMNVKKTNLDIVHLTKSITDSIKVFAEQKSIKLSFYSTLNKKVIGIDEEKYERILLNLLSNAVKYTPEGKSIDVLIFQKVVSGKCKVCIQVSDSGLGIPNDKVDIIFERFGQVDGSLSRQAEGTGIGLYLVKMLIELLGGEILLESKLGHGSKFTIQLPVGKVKENAKENLIQEITDNRLIRATAIEFSDVYLSS